MEYDEALRMGSFSRFFSSFGVAPSGSGSPRLRITRGFPFTRRVGVGGFPAAGQQILLPRLWHCPRLLGPLGLSAIDEVHGFRFRVFCFRGSGSGSQFGGAVVAFFLW